MIRLTPELLSDPDESCRDPRRAVVRLTVRDKDARRRSERRGHLVMAALVAFAAVVLWRAGWFGGGNVYDNATLGERRTAAQEAGERG